MAEGAVWPVAVVVLLKVAAGVVQAHLLPGEAWSETWSDEPWSETGAAIGPALR